MRNSVPDTPTLDHTISVSYIIHLAGNAHNAVVLLGQSLSCVDGGAGGVRGVHAAASVGNSSQSEDLGGVAADDGGVVLQQLLARAHAQGRGSGADGVQHPALADRIGLLRRLHHCLDPPLRQGANVHQSGAADAHHILNFVNFVRLGLIRKQ